MVTFFGCVIISFVISWMIACKLAKDSLEEGGVMVLGMIIGIILSVGASVLGGSCFVKKEIIVEKYVISPMVFDGKIIAGLVEFPSYYTLQIKEDDKTRLIKHNLSKEEIFFTLNEDEERYLKIKKSKTFRRRMWIWFFYVKTGIVKSEAVLKKGDSFLTLPRYSSL